MTNKSYTLAQSTNRFRPVSGPLVAKQNALYVPMSGGSEITRRVWGRWYWNETDPKKVVAWMRSRGIDPLYNGDVGFDWEPYVKHLGPFSEALDGYQVAYDAAKSYAPNARVWFFGPPGVRARDENGDMGFQDAKFWADFMAIPDVLFVQSYIASPVPLRITATQLDRTTKQLGIAVDSGKPVVSVLSSRIRLHGGGRTDMPPKIQAELATAILDAHPSIDGFLQWGAMEGTGRRYVESIDRKLATLLAALWPVVNRRAMT